MKFMTLDQFLKQLRRYRGDFRIEPDNGLIRTTQPVPHVLTVRSALTGEIKERQNRVACLCPIEMVAFGMGLEVDDQALPLRKSVRHHIIKAADANVLGGYTRSVRRRLLKALAIKGE